MYIYITTLHTLLLLHYTVYCLFTEFNLGFVSLFNIFIKQSTHFHNWILMLKAFELLLDVSQVIVVGFSKFFFSWTGNLYGYQLSQVPLTYDPIRKLRVKVIWTLCASCWCDLGFILFLTPVIIIYRAFGSVFRDKSVYKFFIHTGNDYFKTFYKKSKSIR